MRAVVYDRYGPPEVLRLDDVPTPAPDSRTPEIGRYINVGHTALARTARAHAVRAVASSWAALAAVIAVILAFPHTWFDLLVPFGQPTAIPVAMIVAALVVILLPLERIGATIVTDLRATGATSGRLRNIADELSAAIGVPADGVVVLETTIPNVGAFPTPHGVVVMATSQAVEQLQRDELEALVAAQFAGMRDRWCRVATRAELAWTLTKVLAFVSILFALPVAVLIGGTMLFLPRTVEAARDLCADVAAVAATRHPAALASGLRHLVPAASAGHEQRITKRWYLPIGPFLAMPKRLQSTTSVSVDGRPDRTWTEAEEIAAELHLRADRAEALAAGADPSRYTGREYRRRWGQLGTATSPER